MMPAATAIWWPAAEAFLMAGREFERKLAAILAADVVGYSRLMGADEAGTHARLKTLRKELIEPEIAEHRGRMVKLTGDDALVEFASVSTPSSARSKPRSASRSATPICRRRIAWSFASASTSAM